MRIAVTGASGFVGSRVVERARAQGHEAVVLGRSAEGEGARRWDPWAGPAPLQGCDGVVHLAGENVAAGRWTGRKMALIRESRRVGTRNLVAGLRGSGVRVLVSASAVGYYGDGGERELTEDSPPGDDFLASVCRQWEAEASRAEIRTAVIRIGVVLGPGGALGKMRLPFKLGLGGRIGSGLQWMSWIHRDDLADLVLEALKQETFSGPYLAASPNPVRNVEFTRTLGRVLGRPALLPMPRWQVRLLFGKVAQVLCSSQRCLPRRTLEAGFSFRHPDLEPALRDILLQGESPHAPRVGEKS